MADGKRRLKAVVPKRTEESESFNFRDIPAAVETLQVGGQGIEMPWAGQIPKGAIWVETPYYKTMDDGRRVDFMVVSRYNATKDTYDVRITTKDPEFKEQLRDTLLELMSREERIGVGEYQIELLIERTDAITIKGYEIDTPVNGRGIVYWEGPYGKEKVPIGNYRIGDGRMIIKTIDPTLFDMMEDAKREQEKAKEPIADAKGKKKLPV